MAERIRHWIFPEYKNDNAQALLILIYDMHRGCMLGKLGFRVY
jgi:hypothetical protein